MATAVAACKLPHGLQIRLGQKTEAVKMPNPLDNHCAISDEGALVVLNGSQHRNADGFPETVGGYGFTAVDADGFKAWLASNKDHPAVKNGLIFVEKDHNAAKSEARNRAGLKSGAERLDYDNPLGDGSIAPTKSLTQAKSEAAEQQAAAS